jgi:hypothetical protein
MTPSAQEPDNLSEAAALLGAPDEDAAPLPERPRVRAKEKRAADRAKHAAPPDQAIPSPSSPGERRVRIMLEDNDQIPPGGQFVGVNGRGYLIQPGHEVDVPESVLDVLDHAIMSVPVTDGSATVIGYRDRLRYPYRIIRRKGE